MTEAETGRIAPIETIIEEARNGRMTVLIDHEDRENEGDLIIPAQMATPEAINFMATHGRGIICLALTPERIDALGLVVLSPKHRTRIDTAFTVSVEARTGVTSGTSVHDRARTVAVAIDPASGPEDILSPGHVFPLRARPGGVLTRAGHTEAAVDIARIAGLNPSAVICEVLREDGRMARVPDLLPFAARHGLKIGTISDLVAYRLQHDRVVERVAEQPWISPSGRTWRLAVYRDLSDNAEHMAVTLGAVGPDMLVRVHAVSLLDDLLGVDPRRGNSLPTAIQRIEAAGRGVIVIVRDGNPRDLTDRVAEASHPADAHRALRLYGAGAAILRDLDVTSMILLANSPPPRMSGIEGYGLQINAVRMLGEDESDGRLS